MTARKHVALVTGASEGIGLEIARLLAERGHGLLIVSRSEERLREVARELERSHEVSVHYFAADLTRADAPGLVEEEAARRGLHVDLLVNNAGFGLLGRFDRRNRSEQLDMIRLNALALVDLTHRFLGPMVARGQGRILNVASTASFAAGPLMAVYHASKAFVLSFSEGLVRELRGTGVSVTALCPGPVKTGFQRRAGIREESLPKAMIVDVRRVAAAGLDGLEAGKPIVVPGVLNRILAAMTRFAPRRMVREVTFRIQSARFGK